MTEPVGLPGVPEPDGECPTGADRLRRYPGGDDALVGAQGKAAGIFPVDLARILLSATRSDWEQMRWVEAPTPEQFVADLRALGESLILVQ